jgi:hypothetical protein
MASTKRPRRRSAPRLDAGFHAVSMTEFAALHSKLSEVNSI